MDKSDILVTPASQADPESRSVAMRSFGSSWSPRPILAQFLVVLVVVVPFLLAHVVTRELASNWHRPNSLTQLLVLWLVLAAVAVVIMEASLRVTRSLLPLSSLLRMNLAFPRSVPSRFRLALRTGNRSKLRDDLARRSSDTDEAEAYVAMLDLVEELNSHDRATRGHSERVRAYTDLLVRELGLDAVNTDRRRGRRDDRDDRDSRDDSDDDDDSNDDDDSSDDVKPKAKAKAKADESESDSDDDAKGAKGEEE